MLERQRALMIPTCFDETQNRFIASVHTWVLKTPRHVMLIDSCGGNHKDRPALPRFHQQNLPFLARLAEAGVTPDEVDFVCCTHLHADHCGWNTELRGGRWVPTFPNARYIFSKAEQDHWTGPAGQSGFDAGVYADSVLPVIEHGQAEIIDGDGLLANGLAVHATPGHSPGHVVFELADGGEKGLFSGDIMHQPPPGVSSGLEQRLLRRSGEGARLSPLAAGARRRRCGKSVHRALRRKLGRLRDPQPRGF